MTISPLFLQSVAAFCATLFFLTVLAKLAPMLGLIDEPNNRKHHSGSIPVVGGLALFFTLSVGAAIWLDGGSIMITVRGENAALVFLGCAGFLVFTGALDDRYPSGIATRIGAEILVAMVVIELLNLRVSQLGDLAGLGNIRLSPMLSYPFTVVAIFGVINSFNMLDGIDGLLASLVLTTLAMFHFMTGVEPGSVSIFLGASLCAFLVSNLKLTGLIPKTFLGDAGSRLLGFIVVCLLLAAASGQVGDKQIIKPVTALFLIGLPLFDMVFTTLRRVIRKGSPLSADRSHIHHLLIELGLSDRRALVIILSISLSLNIVGLALHKSMTAEVYQLAIFIVSFLLYCLLVSQAWRISADLK